MNSKDKIQHLLITHLRQKGQISLTLPTGIVLDIGVTRETKHGVEKCDDYCWVSTTQDERATFMDQYNLSLQYPGRGMVLDSSDEAGVSLHHLNVV